ncbi:MAG: 4Fe-4S dicluster domain-containing protein [Thermoanaerobaculia bacterium]|nr:4Fe-4S dicluster domain-containing protein [Thermoanaerobaculia bacterium]
MPTVRIEEHGCRGCSLCVDLCPVQVFEQESAAAIARVTHAERCIGCLSCVYACPSQCVEVDGYLRLRPFHRIEASAELVRRFLQEQPVSEAVTSADLEEAWSDVAARLFALSDTVVETIGKGYRAVARRAGVMSAEHLPEMYEATSLDEVLAALKKRFAHAFDFDYTIAGEQAKLRFNPCGLCRVVRSGGQTVGDAQLCQMFHEYWIGLISTFVGTRYKCQVPVVGDVCEMELSPVE